jgi:hypothetical protein
MVEYQEQNLLGTRPAVIVSATFRRKVALTGALADGVHKTQRFRRLGPKWGRGGPGWARGGSGGARPRGLVYS